MESIVIMILPGVMAPEKDDFHENDTRKDAAAQFRCRAAAKLHLGAEIPLSSSFPEIGSSY
jgi:hypothetical protein